MFFSLFFLEDPDPDLYLWLMDPDPGAQKHLDPTDLDSDPDRNTGLFIHSKIASSVVEP